SFLSKLAVLIPPLVRAILNAMFPRDLFFAAVIVEVGPGPVVLAFLFAARTQHRTVTPVDGGLPVLFPVLAKGHFTEKRRAVLVVGAPDAGFSARFTVPFGLQSTVFPELPCRAFRNVILVRDFLNRQTFGGP